MSPMQNSLRFDRPIEVPRARGTHRLEAFSLKLARRLSLYSRSAFDLWLCIESDPAVQAFCERPGFIELGEKQHLVEFWVRYADHEEVTVLTNAEATNAAAIEIAPPSIASPLAVRVIQPADLAAARTWINNWERMLPCIVANRNLLSASQLQAIVCFLRMATPLSIIVKDPLPFCFYLLLLAFLFLQSRDCFKSN
jgi:hypothetical protein